MAGLVDQMLDRYHLRERIGRGGMASVYRAVDTRNLREVALKVLSPTMVEDRRFLRRFRREAELVKQRLRHPGIVPVIDYGQVRGFVYLVMPFVAGETLQERMLTRGVTLKGSARWINQVAQALSFAHEQGIIHRDIKPSNVLINQAGDAMLTDFGLAREVEGSSTLTGSMLMGTPAYISPEQGRGNPLDARSDQYSLGVILYQIATGRLPFEADSPMGTVIAHLQEPVPNPSRFNPDLPTAVEKVILKSLAKNRADRFESVKALNECYQDAIAGRPIPELSLPASVWETAALEGVPEAVRRPPAQGPRPQPRRALRWIIPVALLALLAALFVGFPGLLGLDPGNSPGQSTQIPTATLQPATATRVPITDTPVPTAVPPVTSQDCPGIKLYAPEFDGNYVEWLWDNGMETPVNIQDLQLTDWPASNGKPEKILFRGEVVWEGEFAQGEVIEMVESADLSLPPGVPVVLAFKFHWSAGRSPYALQAVLDAGCTLSGRW